MSRKISFTPTAWKDYEYWQGQDKKTLKRINALIKENDELSWHKEICSMVRENSFKDLYESIKEYHKKQKKARHTTEELDIEKFKPKFKSKRKKSIILFITYISNNISNILGISLYQTIEY